MGIESIAIVQRGVQRAVPLHHFETILRLQEAQLPMGQIAARRVVHEHRQPPQECLPGDPLRRQRKGFELLADKRVALVEGRERLGHRPGGLDGIRISRLRTPPCLPDPILWITRLLCLHRSFPPDGLLVPRRLRLASQQEVCDHDEDQDSQ